MARVQKTFPSFKRGNRKDVVTLFDSVGEFADAVQADGSGAERRGGGWAGNDDLDTTIRKCRTGDLARAASSDEYMSKLENKFVFESSAFRNVDALTGGVPNVGAFLAGNPMNMRQRRRVQTEAAPLNIVIDVVSSGGIESRDLERRGAALLALVRLLSAQRPVNLWVAASALPYSATSTHTASAVAFRVDTAPLDLARAAHVLCSTGVARQMAYGFVSHQVGAPNGELHWPYDDHEFSRQRGAEFWQRAFGMEEMLFIAPPFVKDEMIQQPEKWLTDMLAKYGRAAE